MNDVLNVDGIKLSDLTDTSLEGTGVFDTLMRSASTHLERELNGNRITGDQYSTVYTTIVATVMEQSINFLLDRARLNLEIELNNLAKEKVQAEIDLLRQKLVTEKAQVMDATLLDPTANAETSLQVGEDPDLYLFNSVQPVAGVIGRKNSTFERQIAGYNDDYKLKTVRTILDAFKVLLVNSLDVEFLPDGFDGENITSLIEAIREDAGLSEE